MNLFGLYRLLELKQYFVFSLKDLSTFFPGEKRENLKKITYRWRKNGRIASLKRGLFEITFPNQRAIPDLYIANRLYEPSYVSLETALSKYSIIPEVSMAVTSITTKPTRKFKNKHGLFIYRTIRPCAFSGYFVEKHRGFNVLIAEPEKALIDYLYFAGYHNKNCDLGQARLNKDIIAKLDKRKLKKYAQLYNLNLRRAYAYLWRPA
jgi:predicted transcriptional regulator of viral defense system